MKVIPKPLYILMVLAMLAGMLGIQPVKPVQALATDLFFSEYIEGTSSNKAVEIFNGTGASVDLSNYVIRVYANGSATPSSTIALSGTLANNDVFVVANSSANAAIKAVADLTSGSLTHNGDDAVTLNKTSGSFVDVIGQTGYDPGEFWGTEPITTINHTLVRKCAVDAGDRGALDPFIPATEWDSYAQDTTTYLGSHTMSCGPAEEIAPTVASTVPADGADNVAVDANIIITFSEFVTVTDPDPWFTISCSESGIHTAAVSHVDSVFTLVPSPVFANSETCTVTVLAANVSDDDLVDPPDNMTDDYTFAFDTVEACGDPFTAIYAIQGSGDSSPLAGQTVTTEGVVVGDFQVGGKNGFFIQDETGDGDPFTSDGIFVYYPGGPDVNVGDKLRLSGSVDEYYELTQIKNISSIQTCTTATITPIPLELPFASTNHEHLEGMLVTFPQALVISEYYNFDYYGELLLTSERHSTPTAVVEPGQDAIDMAEYHLLDSIAMDDGSSYSNPSFLRHPDGSAFGSDNYFRGGDTIAGLTGVMDYNFDEYKIQPVGTAVYETLNLRTEAPELVPGEIRIASLNVLNYFTTLDAGTSAWICGPSGTMECRGADANQPLELARQQVKIVNAILGMDADIVGLMEIENEHPGQTRDEPVISLVTLLNEATAAGTYDYIATGPLGTDAIKQAILYKTEKVEVVGEYAVLDSSVDPRFDTSRNRPSLAQTFKDKITQEIFTVSVNHLKSKGSECGEGDDDPIYGGGNCNLTRTLAAEALVEWLETDPTATGSDMYVIIGDLNSYAMEDPIDMIILGADDLPDTADDYLNLVDRFREPVAYGYVYDGQTGYLDHALGNRKFASYVLDANFWHINADETRVFDYDTSNKKDEVDAMFDPTTPYRSSDHDPVLISVLLNHSPLATDDTYTTPAGTVLNVMAPGVLENDSDVNIYDKITASLVAGSGPLHGELVFDADGSFTYTPDPGYVGIDTLNYVMHATPGLMSNYADTAIVIITVTEVKDQVVAVDDFYATNEDTLLSVAASGVLENDIDDDNNPRAAVLVTDVQNGSLSLMGDGSFTYMPDPDFNGTDTFVYRLLTYPALQSQWTDEATVTITVNSIADAPVLGFIENAIIPELVEFSFTATATDVDRPAQALTFSLVGAPTGAAITSAGVFSWTPTGAQGAGVYSFNVKVCDDTNPTPLCDKQAVTLTVTEVNAAPVAQNLSATTQEDTPVDVTMVAFDAENDGLTYTVVAQPAHGTVSLVGATANYSPELDYNGPDSFTYKANDGLVDSNVATVSITVTAVNDAPVAVDDEYTMAEKTTLTIAAPGVLDNDSDIDGDNLTAILVETVSNGILTLYSDGSFTYTPNEYFNGTDSFTYKAKDAVLESELAVVTITVTPVNDWPIANDDFYEILTGTELVKGKAEGILANDVLLDPDEEVSIQILEGPQHGILVMNDDGSFNYMPDANFMGTDTFRYLILSVRTINAEWSDDAIVTIAVNPYMRLFLPLILR